MIKIMLHRTQYVPIVKSETEKVYDISTVHIIVKWDIYRILSMNKG
jgi:hypothetical protein